MTEDEAKSYIGCGDHGFGRFVGKHEEQIYCCAISVDGSLFVTGGDDGFIVWSTATGTEEFRVSGPSKGIKCVLSDDVSKMVTIDCHLQCTLVCLKKTEVIYSTNLEGSGMIKHFYKSEYVSRDILMDISLKGDLVAIGVYTKGMYSISCAIINWFDSDVGNIRQITHYRSGGYVGIHYLRFVPDKDVIDLGNGINWKYQEKFALPETGGTSSAITKKFYIEYPHDALAVYCSSSHALLSTLFLPKDHRKEKIKIHTISLDGSIVISGTAEGNIFVYNLNTEEKSGTLAQKCLNEVIGHLTKSADNLRSVRAAPEVNEAAVLEELDRVADLVVSSKTLTKQQVNEM